MKEIAHNDIKCENFVFDKEFDIKLIDFGLATTTKFISSEVIGTQGFVLFFFSIFFFRY